VQQARLIVEPDDGTAPILNAIRHAKSTIDLTIFRFDRQDVASALEAAVARGVQVRALIAFSNRGGVHSLRRLEWRLLDAGAAVARSNDDFARYHAKLMVVDRRALHVYGFNLTREDLSSRSFGIITTNRRLAQQATSLFEADFAHRPYDGGTDGLVVSPENARERLEAFIQGARHELLIYDSRLGDRRVLRLLAERVRAGIAVRIIGHAGKDVGSSRRHSASHLDVHADRRLESFLRGGGDELPTADSTRTDGRVRRQPDERVKTGLDSQSIGDAGKEADVRVATLHHHRMHLRAIVRDGTVAFVGSQSLRKSELDARREVGVFVHQPDVVRQIRETFERDWPPDTSDLVVSAERVSTLP